MVKETLEFDIDQKTIKQAEQDAEFAAFEWPTINNPAVKGAIVLSQETLNVENVGRPGRIAKD